MEHLRLLLAYDGADYSGWQDNGLQPSVEAELRKALCQVLGDIHRLQAASRTDSGVHALGQVVTFYTTKEVNFSRLKASLNSLLPPSIRTLSIDSVDQDFHPTLNSTSKEYHFHLCTAPVLLPLERHRMWHYPYNLDLKKMRTAAEHFIGIHDFIGFCNANLPATYEDSVRTLYRVDVVEERKDLLRIEVVGSHFLYKMVRNIVGTLAQIGRGYLPLETVKQVLHSKKRTQAGMTAPAHGLCLIKVYYS